MIVSLAACLGVASFNGVRARCNDDPCACTVTQNSVVGGSAIIGSIGSELADLIVDLIQQGLQLRSIAGFLICQAMGNDLATVGINSQMGNVNLSSSGQGRARGLRSGYLKMGDLAPHLHRGPSQLAIMVR